LLCPLLETLYLFNKLFPIKVKEFIYKIIEYDEESMAHRTHQQERIRKKAIKTGLKEQAILPFDTEEQLVITDQLLPFILTHFFPTDKQKIIRRFLHEIRSENKKKGKKHAKRSDTLTEKDEYRTEHPLHNTHTKIMQNRTASGMAKSKKLKAYMTKHKSENVKNRKK
jgi:hypothetical protein